jgi:hypothetical protein
VFQKKQEKKAIAASCLIHCAPRKRKKEGNSRVAVVAFCDAKKIKIKKKATVASRSSSCCNKIKQKEGDSSCRRLLC